MNLDKNSVKGSEVVRVFVGINIVVIIVIFILYHIYLILNTLAPYFKTIEQVHFATSWWA